MRKILKWIGFSLAALVGPLILAVAIIYTITEAKLNQVYDVSVEAIPVPSDPAAIERGRHLVTTLGFCTDCHGQDLAGEAYDDGLLIGLIGVENLTPGQGGISNQFSDTDWVRAIRHGIAPNGRTLIDMPSNYYYNLSDADLGAIIAYLKRLPAIDKEIPETRVGPIARIYILQEPSLLPAQVIDHTAPRPPAPERGVTAEYGHYLASFSCMVCHGENLAGHPGGGAGENLTPAGNLATWTETDFVHTLRTGVTPDGRTLDSEMMPWDITGQFSDEELKAIWLYLKSLPPIETPGQ